MRILALLLTFYCFFITTNFAQKAPDFTATTTTGEEIKLYEDFLDQGKSVVIEIFFVGCPPCRRLAPHMATLHQKMVQQNVAVEFISLTTMSNDSDADMEEFKTEFGHDWHFVGHEGGGQTALNVYQDGTFGAYWGTPTTLVIAPDGTVNYNVRGDINSGTWTANLETAILASQMNTMPEITPPAMAVLTGQVQTPTGQGLGGVTIQVAGAKDTTFTTDPNGAFTAGSLLADTSYTVSVEKNNTPSNGVTTADIIVIAKHILGIDTFTQAHQVIAADVNSSGSVTTFDLVIIRQLILGIITEFPNTPSWFFDPNQVVLASLNELDDLVFTGIKKGDLNNSAVPNQWSAIEDRNLKNPVTFFVQDRYFDSGELVSVPLTSKIITELEGFQFTTRFNPNVLQFNKIQTTDLKTINANNFNIKQKEKGIISTSWHTLEPQHSSSVFSIEFTTLQAGKLSDVLTINSDLTKAEAYRFGRATKPISLAFYPVKQEVSEAITLFPNPVSTDAVFVNMAANTTQNFTLLITDIRGKILQRSKHKIEKGSEATIPLDTRFLQAGVYRVQVLNDKKTLVQALPFVKL